MERVLRNSHGPRIQSPDTAAKMNSGVHCAENGDKNQGIRVGRSVLLMIDESGIRKGKVLYDSEQQSIINRHVKHRTC